MAITFGDILLNFRAETTEVDSAFARLDRRAGDFASRTGRNLEARFTGDDSGLQQTAQRSEGMLAQWSGRVRGFLAQSLTIPAGNAISGIVGSVVGAIKGSVIGMNASLESTTLQFTTLMGDADLATQHVRGLFEFAKNTPFETEPVLNASRLLQTFGGNALNTREELTRLGDASAVASRDIGEVGFYYGRMYTSIQNNQSIYDAGTALQEMGVLSGETFTRLDAMQKSGASGAVIWAAFQQEMDKNAGAMARMASTWTGLTSSLSDTIAINAASIFEPFFQMAKEAVLILLTVLSSERFNGFVTAAKAAVGGIADSLRTAGEAVLPLVAMVWGVMEPLLVIAWDWGSGFVKAFADGITLATGLVGDAIGGLANLITGLLEPHSPPKILPDLDTWGTKTAQVWMDGWKEVDYGLFDQIGSSIQKALANAVGTGAMKEADQIPMLAKAKAALAELMSNRSSSGTFNEDDLVTLKTAAGPAGQAVYDLAESYLKLDWASRQVAMAQDDLNTVTDRYAAILNPLNAQLSGVQRQMALVRDQQRLSEIAKKLPTATGDERQLLMLEQQQIAIQRQITVQEQAKAAEVAVAQTKITSAQTQEKAFKSELATVQAKQKMETDSLAMAQQQVNLLTKLADGQVAQAAASAGVKKNLDAAASSAAVMQKRVDDLVAKMGRMRETGTALVKPITEGWTFIRQTWDGVVSGFRSDGLTGALVSLVSAAGGVKLLFTPMGQQLMAVTNAMKPFTDGLLALPQTIRNAFSGFQSNGLTGAIESIARDTGHVAALFTPMGQQILAFTTALPGRIQAIAAAFGGMIGQVATFGATVIFPAMVSSLLTLVPLMVRMANAIGNLAVSVGPQLAAGLAAGVAAFGRFGAVITTAWDAATAVFAGGGGIRGAIVAFFASLGGAIQTGLPGLWESGKTMASGLIDGIAKQLPAGLGAKLPRILGAITSVFAGLSFGPALAGMVASLAPIGAMLAPIGGIAVAAFAPVGLILGKVGPLLARVAPSLGGLRAAFFGLMNPLALLRGGFGSLMTGGIGLLLPILDVIMNPLGALRGLFMGIGPALMGLKNPVMLLLNLGKTVLGLFSPLGILITLVSLFAGAFATNFGGIQGIVATTIGPVMPLLSGLATVFSLVLGQLLQGNWSGAFSLLSQGFRELGPLLSGAATSFQTGIPAIFGVLMAFLGQILTNVIGWIGAALPPIITGLGVMAAAFIAWVLPMIPPMLASLGSLLGSILDAVGLALPGILGALATMAGAFILWVGPQIPPLLLALGGLLTSLLGWITERAPGVLAKMGEWGLQVVGWVALAIPPLLIGLGTLLAGLIAWIGESAPGILTKLGEWATQFVTWATTVAGPALKTALGGMFTTLWTELQALWGAAFAEGSLGKTILDSIKSSITKNWESFGPWFAAKLEGVLPDWLVEGLKRVGRGAQKVKDAVTGDQGGGGAPVTTGVDIPVWAAGTDFHPGGLALVGEEGPELVNLPRGSSVTPAGKTAAILSSPLMTAVNSPLASLDAAMAADTTRTASASAGAAGAAGAARTGSAGTGGGAGGAGPTVNVAFTVNNPVVDSDARLQQMKREAITEMTQALTAMLGRLTLGGI